MANKNTPQAKGVRTAYQTIAGTVVAYFGGLLALPEVREYTNAFIHQEGVAALLALLAAFGIGAGIISFIQNKVESKE